MWYHFPSEETYAAGFEKDPLTPLGDNVEKKPETPTQEAGPGSEYWLP